MPGIPVTMKDAQNPQNRTRIRADMPMALDWDEFDGFKLDQHQCVQQEGSAILQQHDFSCDPDFLFASWDSITDVATPKSGGFWAEGSSGNPFLLTTSPGSGGASAADGPSNINLLTTTSLSGLTGMSGISSGYGATNLGPVSAGVLPLSQPSDAAQAILNTLYTMNNCYSSSLNDLNHNNLDDNHNSMTDLMRHSHIISANHMGPPAPATFTSNGSSSSGSSSSSFNAPAGSGARYNTRSLMDTLSSRQLGCQGPQPVSCLDANKPMPPVALPGGINAMGDASSGMCEAVAVAAATSASVYVKNLPPEETELSLYRMFAPLGAVQSCKVLTDPASGRCRGVGFVNYRDHAEAVRAVHALNGTRLGVGRQLQVALQAPRTLRAVAAANAAATTCM